MAMTQQQLRPERNHIFQIVLKFLRVFDVHFLGVEVTVYLINLAIGFTGRGS
jgi:hypothetical protein